jgi:hypothetical protein
VDDREGERAVEKRGKKSDSAGLSFDDSEASARLFITKFYI